jgi:hypothetical protein
VNRAAAGGVPTAMSTNTHHPRPPMGTSYFLGRSADVWRAALDRRSAPSARVRRAV